MHWWIWLGYAVLVFIALLVLVTLYDRFFQTKNLVLSNFPLLGRFRYFFHELRPFFRQYFGDDNAFTPRIIIDWILNVSGGKTGYFAFDKFDSTGKLNDRENLMIHAASPLNEDEMKPEFPVLGPEKKLPMAFNSYFYRSAMSLGALGFEATAAMAAACADIGAPFNTGEGGLAVHHIPRVKFSYDRKFFKYYKVSPAWKPLYYGLMAKRLKINFIDFLGKVGLGKHRDLYLFDEKQFVFYTIDWEADLKHFPQPGELTDEFGHVIFQIGSGLYGLRKKTKDGSFDFDWDGFKKRASFCRAFEIKLAQGAKQTGGILKAKKNTPVVAEIRGMHPGIDLISPNRFPFYEAGKEKEFFQFMDQVSEAAGGKPVGCKIVISSEDNIEPLAVELAKTKPGKGPSFITVDGGDGGSGAAPIALSVLFGKKIYDAIPIVVKSLEKHKVRDRVKVLASAKLYAPHMSGRIMALGADAVGNARSIMIAGGCIRAGLCSGENGNCPVGLATMHPGKRKAYKQTWDAKVKQISNYIKAHNKGLIQVAAICGVPSPSKLAPKHVACNREK